MGNWASRAIGRIIRHNNRSLCKAMKECIEEYLEEYNSVRHLLMCLQALFQCSEMR